MQHNCSNPNAKIFLYNIILRQMSEQTKIVFSINDYIRFYKQKYMLTVNAFGTLSQTLERLESQDRIDFKKPVETSNVLSPISIKSCELFPDKRISFEKYPDLNDLEIELLLIFSSLVSFLIVFWLIVHKLCNQRVLQCYFNHFKIGFILTLTVYLIMSLLYKFVFKREQMKAIYFRRSSIWSFGTYLLKLILIAASLVAVVIIYSFKIDLYAFEFYAGSLSLMYIVPLFILVVDLFNHLIKNVKFINSLTFKSFKSNRSAGKSQAIAKREKLDSNTSTKTNSSLNQSSEMSMKPSDLFKSTEFKPSIDDVSESNKFIKNHYSSERDEMYTDLKRSSKSKRSRS